MEWEACEGRVRGKRFASDASDEMPKTSQVLKHLDFSRRKIENPLLVGGGESNTLLPKRGQPHFRLALIALWVS